ncbi:MAG: hypothetical protein QME66_06505 [Candidatus Eisenbacteria bacterium]|nr:hypothetical protein [Candidatus Eisenbacteria bacterium]
MSEITEKVVAGPDKRTSEKSAGSPVTQGSGEEPRAAIDLDRRELRNELRLVAGSKLFWAGLAAKLCAAILFGSHFATRWFAPFFYEFVHTHFSNPWQIFLGRGEPLAFPYGPGMLLVGAISWLPALIFSFDPASHIGLLLLRLPLLAADIVVCLLLVRWTQRSVREVLIVYWLSPVIFYATYIHGQLDLIPTALLCAALYLIFTKRITLGALVFGLALAAKGHIIIAVPFAAVYLFRLPRRRLAWFRFSLVSGLMALALYAYPLTLPAFREMVLGSPEAKKIWAVAVPYGQSGLLLYAAPAVLMVTFLRFASYRKINRELTLWFLGALYLALVSLVPPQPGWFVWSIPFIAYLGARFTRSGRFVVFAISSAYLVYFFIGDPLVFLESLDPTMGKGFGSSAAAALQQAAPALFGTRASSIAWTLLFSTTSLAVYVMYRRGVRSNSIYRFRDESFMIGIAGDSGAGKHTLGRDLTQLFGSQISLIEGDDDHKWERGHAMWRRYSHLNPRGNRLQAQLEGLMALRRGGEVRKRRYDHDKGRFTPVERIQANDFMAVIGLHLFYLASQRPLFHLRVFMDPDEDLRRAWKLARDTNQRGYTVEEASRQMDERMEDARQFVRPQMGYADLVVRHKLQTSPTDTSVYMELELSSLIEPHLLIDVLEEIPSLSMDWNPAETLNRDRITIDGDVDAEQLRTMASALIPNLDELVQEGGWLPGGRGLAQLIVVHAISTRLRGDRFFSTDSGTEFS